MTDQEQEPTFTIEDANACLPDLRERLSRIRTARQEILRSSKRIRDRVAADGGGHDGRDYFEALHILRTDIEHLSAQGILLRDAEAGLVDFPSEVDGRRVFLCWRLGEERVAFWHGVDTGFAGRVPL